MKFGIGRCKSTFSISPNKYLKEGKYYEACTYR